MFSVGWIVDILVKAAVAVITASIACAWRAIPAFAGVLLEVLAFRKAFPAILAVPIVCAFPRQRTLELLFPVQFDFLPNGGIVFADGFGNCGFS